MSNNIYDNNNTNIINIKFKDQGHESSIPFMIYGDIDTIIAL